jgi:hypothetical protein
MINNLNSAGERKMVFHKKFLEIWILVTLLFLVSCASDRRPENTSSYSQRTVEKTDSGQDEKLYSEILVADTDSICGKSRDTESCSDLGVLIKNSSNHYTFTTEQTMTHGSVTTPIPKSIAPLKDGFSLLDQSGYGADTTISFTNSDGNDLSVDVLQDYCFWKGQDVFAWPSENSKQVTMSCEVQN